MKTRNIGIVLGLIALVAVVVRLLVAPVQAAASEGSGGGEPIPTPRADQRSTVEVIAYGEAYGYPAAGAPSVGRVDTGDTVRVIEQRDDWYRIEVVERALGRPVVPLADGWVAEDVFGKPLDGVPPATQPPAIPTATATPGSSPSLDGSPPRVPTAAVSTVPSDAANGQTSEPTQIPLDYAVPSGAANDQTPEPTHIPLEYAVPPVPVQDALPGRGQSTGMGGMAPGASRPAVPVSRVIIVQQCNDVNKNRQCDVGEGIGGVVGFVLNARTGQVVNQAVSNTRGITQIPITTLNSEQLVLNVPFLDEYQSLTGTDGRTQPIIVDNSAGLSGLLP